MTNDLWQDMKDEYLNLGGPGKLWLTEIEKLAQQVINKKVFERLPPSIFGFPNWDKDDLVQLVIAERLIGRNQARYIFDTADSIEDARKILRNEISFALADRRVPNQVDNVWGNLEPLLTSMGWQPSASIQEDEDSLERQVTKIVLSQKRMRNRGAKNFSPIFAGPVLEIIAQQIIEIEPNLPTKLILKALRSALTIISPSLSIEGVDGIEENPQIAKLTMATGEENLSVERARYGTARFEIALDICEKLDDETLEIIFHKGNGANQSEIGAVLGVTRQTAKGRIDSAEVSLRETILGLEIDATDYKDVLAALMDVLGVQKNEVLA